MIFGQQLPIKPAPKQNAIRPARCLGVVQLTLHVSQDVKNKAMGAGQSALDGVCKPIR